MMRTRIPSRLYCKLNSFLNPVFNSIGTQHPEFERAMLRARKQGIPLMISGSGVMVMMDGSGMFLVCRRRRTSHSL